MPLFYLKSSSTSDPTSGISGSPEINEPRPARRPPFELWAALRSARRSMVGTARAVPRIVVLVWRASPRLTIGLAVATLIVGLVPAATAIVTRLLINTVTNAVSVRASGGPDVSVVGPLLGIQWQATTTGAVVAVLTIQFGLLVLHALFGAIRTMSSELLQELVSQDIQARVMQRSSELELAFFEDANSYDLIRQAQEEASTRPVAMIANLYGTLETTVTIGSVVVLLFSLNPWIALMVIAAPIPAFIADSWYGKVGFVVATWSSPLRRRMRYLSTLVTTDTYAKEVKVFGLGGYLIGRFRSLGSVYYRRHRRQVVGRSLAGTGLGALTTFVGSLAYLYAGLETVAGRLSIGDLVMYTAATMALQVALQALLQELTGMYENNLYLDTLQRLMALRPAITAPAEPTPMPQPLLGRIEFENVTFTYPGAAAPALRDVSLTIDPGSALAVVGCNGAGKSTLVKLACRLYDPQEGRILLDGTDLREFDPDELRKAVSAVFQDHVTYQATAAENIGLGDVRHLLDRLRIEAAAVKGGAHPLISGLPQGFDTPLGKWFDKGVNLSGGEWQKMALSRAFVREATILVFDEPTSALDPVSERDLFLRLQDLAKGRTTIYISHRFSTVRHADRIVLLADGGVAEQGDHSELMAADGEYARLFSMQASAYVDLSGERSGIDVKG